MKVPVATAQKMRKAYYGPYFRDPKFIRTLLEKKLVGLGDAGPSEADRLGAQLDALRSEDAGDTRERAELRQLVEHQLDLVRRMQNRRELVMRERASLVDLLRNLWTLVCATGESHDRDSGASERLRALCMEIQLETNVQPEPVRLS